MYESELRGWKVEKVANQIKDDIPTFESLVTNA